MAARTFSNTFSTIITIVCVAATLPGLCVSCAPKNVEVTPPVQMPAGFSANGDATLPKEWWTVFNDEKLNSLMSQAISNNFSIRMAWDRLDQARATAEKSGAPLLPSLDGSAGASRTVMKTATTDRTYTTELSLGLAASYEVDLWGRVRSTYDASVFDVHASKEDLQAAAITVTAEVARTWYQLIEQRGQIRLLDDQIETNRKYLEIITLKFRRGQVSATDVFQQQQLIEQTIGEKVLVESAATVLEHKLAILLGKSPGSPGVSGFDVPESLPQLPPSPKAGLPMEWLRRRPDVIAAELRVQAADKRVAAAIADQFPKLGLTVTAETSGEQIRDIFDNWLASLAANLTAPLFDAGLRKAEVERTRAVVSEKLNSYGDVLLGSLKEVEDAMSEEARQTEYVASLTRQLELSDKSTKQILENYTKGTVDFTRYLTTLLSHQKLQRTHLQAQLELIHLRIDLYRALAGSWSLPRPARAVVEMKSKPADPPNSEG